MDSRLTDPLSCDSMNEDDDEVGAYGDVSTESYADGDDTTGSPFPPIASPARSRSSSGCIELAEDPTNSTSVPVLIRSAGVGVGTSGSNMGRLVCSVLSTECRITGLRPGCTYAFRVRACNRVGRSPWTDWTKVTTVPGPPGAPRHAPRVHPLGETGSILIEWDPVRQGNGTTVSGYILEWQPISYGLTSVVTPSSCAELCDFQLVRFTDQYRMFYFL